MKKQTSLITTASIFTIALFVLFSCEKDKAPEPPSGNTNKISFANITTNNIDARNASFTCSIDTLANNRIQQHGFCWNTQENPDITKDRSELGIMNNAGEFTNDLTNLQPDTKYYIKAYLTFNDFTIYSEQATFTTNPLGTPTVTTNEIINITANSAASGGNITDNGGSSITARGVCWSTTQNPTISDSHTTDGTGTGSFTSNITGLSLDVTYYVRAYATNSIGTVYGQNRNFITYLVIGDIYAGGIVFYLDGSGGGLVCAESDQSTNAEWGCYGTTIGGTGTAIGTGAANTAATDAGCGEAGIAARICNDLVLNGKNDWFLPSIDELNLMYENLKLAGIGGFAGVYYWSSSEYSSHYAWGQYFIGGNQLYYNKYGIIRVRAVRAF